MYTQNDLMQCMKELGIDPAGTLLVHSSMKAVGPVQGGADTVLNAFSAYMQQGLLIFPTHSYRTVGQQTDLFDVLQTPSCVGILGNLFRQREGVIRSLHPTHSVAALGKDAAAYTGGEEKATTPCPRDGCWGRLYDRDAQILFLGCTLKSNTFLHGVEEWAQIPDRLSPWTQRLRIRDANGKEYITNMHRHCCSKGGVSEWYDKMQPVFERFGAIRYGKLGDAACILCSARKMADCTTRILQQMEQLFSDGEPVPTHLYL